MTRTLRSARRRVMGSAAAFLLALLVVATPLWWFGPHPLQIVGESLDVLEAINLAAGPMLEDGQRKHRVVGQEHLVGVDEPLGFG